jgi:Acyl carrier protein
MNEKVINIFKTVLGIDAFNEDIAQSNCDQWDSMAHLNLVIELEGEFNITFEPEEIAKLKTFQDVICTVNEKIG